MILQALDKYYDRMAARGEAPLIGYVSQSVRWEVVLSSDGEVLNIAKLGEGKHGQTLFVPEPVTEPSARTATAIVPYFLADNPSYLLGLKPGDNRVQSKFERSAAFHTQLLSATKDKALRAVPAFFQRYMSQGERKWPLENYDAVCVFKLGGDSEWLHQKAEAREIWNAYLDALKMNEGSCLVTGTVGTIVRLHPKLGGFKDADTLVGFDKASFRSYGQDQGANAPTSKAAAHRYGAALNAMLASGGRNRLRRGIGEATVVFWADASGAQDEPAADATETAFAQIFAPPAEAPQEDGDAGQTAKLLDALTALAEGRPQTADPRLKPGVRFNVLGLSPNAARLSVRFWLSDSFEVFARAILRHMRDLAIEPAPRGWTGKKGPPEMWRLLEKTTALQEKFENVPPLLAGELARAVLGGGPYPRTWLTAALMRLRAGDDPSSGWHAAAIKACINRNPQEEDLPVALDPENKNVGYQLGRLFAVIEQAQSAALGRVNATVADRYYGAASSTPARVFAGLLRNARNHMADAKKRGGGFWIERKLEEIVGHLSDLPTTLKLEDQGRFAVGYYHERASRPAKMTDSAAHATDTDAEPATQNIDNRSTAQ